MIQKLVVLIVGLANEYLTQSKYVEAEKALHTSIRNQEE